MKKMMFALLAATSIAGAADAATVLYRVDGNVGTDRMAQALSNLGYTVTATAGDLSSFTLGNYDIVVYANQNNGIPGGDTTKLDAYIAGNGKVIFTTWTGTPPSLGANFDGSTNGTSITVGPLFNAGITNPLTLTNPGWGVFSRGLTLTTGTSAGTFGGSDAIVVGNGGRTIFNGFLTDTLSSSVLFENQLGYLVNGTAVVPEPTSWAMLIAGFGLVGAAARRRRTVVAA